MWVSVREDGFVGTITRFRPGGQLWRLGFCQGPRVSSQWKSRVNSRWKSTPALLFRRNSLLLAPSIDSGDQKKPNACLRLVRLAEGATERPIFEGSCRQARNHRDPGHVNLPKLGDRETKPFRARMLAPILGLLEAERFEP